MEKGQNLPMQDYGTVCDISALTDRESINKTKKLFQNSGLYIPSATYSWLSRSQLIEVRNKPVKYSLLKQQVRKGKIYPAHLPDIYDELSRQIMFRANHNIALTDLRALLLSSHLKLPLFTLDDDLFDKISKEIGVKKIASLEAHSSWLTIREVLELYRELSFQAGRIFKENLKDEIETKDMLNKIRDNCEKSLETSRKSVEKFSNGRKNPGTLRFGYFTWDIMADVEEYSNQKLLKRETFHHVCEKFVFMIAKPVSFQEYEG